MVQLLLILCTDIQINIKDLEIRNLVERLRDTGATTPFEILEPIDKCLLINFLKGCCESSVLNKLTGDYDLSVISGQETLQVNNPSHGLTE